MTNLRSAALALLLAAALAGCDAGTTTTGDASAPDRPADLAQVRDACVAATADSLKTFTDDLTADQSSRCRPVATRSASLLPRPSMT
ncbi:hypothetical protein OHT93_36675 [Streptomyces sp. NBC_00191]|uniref:hypothetical protein n=1 Tax=Streptomyces sp. NBC_00191 TaxID=2975674 RepID=UPI0032562898